MKCIGSTVLDPEALKEDRKSMHKIGPCGVGRKAIYLNSFYFSRRYYICWQDIARVFKRVALSKGGYSGKGVFASIPYLVVEKKDGSVKQCNFKFEEQVDKILAKVEEEHPNIPTHSRASEEKLEKAAHALEMTYVDSLTPEAEQTIAILSDAKRMLERGSTWKELTFAAKNKRVQDNIRPTWRITAILLFGGAALLALYGIYSFTQHGSYSLEFLLAGLAILAVVLAARVLPTGTQNRKAAEKDWQTALADMERYLKNQQRGQGTFPVPVQYAHPIVLERMIRIVRQGKAQTPEEALDVLKSELRALNRSVTVSQSEYDEIMAIKPMFLVCNYE
jgi:hypothetical protein